MAPARATVYQFGRPSKAHLHALTERAEEAEAELLARHDEAITLVNELRPLIARLVPGAIEIGPRHYQTVVAALNRLARFESQQFPDPDDDGEAVAA